MPGHILDVCECGDYRHQHERGGGRCKLGSLCAPTPCQKFRLFRYYMAHAEDEVTKPAPRSSRADGEENRDAVIGEKRGET